MLEDRDYMRQPSYGGRSCTVTLIVVLLVVFVIQASLMFYSSLPLIDWFGLSLDGFKHFYFWQVVTFQFLHLVPWPWHVLMNCLGLYFLGRSLEETLGKRKFLTLYFASGVLGGFLQLLVTAILPRHMDFPVVGASAGIMGLLGAYAILYPMREITIFVMFFPVTLRVSYIFWFALAISAFGTLIPFDSTAEAAHLGGLLSGVAFIKWNLDPMNLFSKLRSPGKKMKSRGPQMAFPKFAALQKEAGGESPKVSQSEEFMSEQVDPILDKISQQGIQSLTDKERQILQAARSRMGKR